jgi:hypothetical protein
MLARLAAAPLVSPSARRTVASARMARATSRIAPRCGNNSEKPWL